MSPSWRYLVRVRFRVKVRVEVRVRVTIRVRVRVRVRLGLELGLGLDLLNPRLGLDLLRSTRFSRNGERDLLRGDVSRRRSLDEPLPARLRFSCRRS